MFVICSTPYPLAVPPLIALPETEAQASKAVPTYFKFAYSRICFAEFINKIHLEFAIGSPGDYVLFKLSVLSHFLQRSAIRDMKFGQIVERIVFMSGPSIADIEKYPPILMGSSPLVAG